MLQSEITKSNYTKYIHEGIQNKGIRTKDFNNDNMIDVKEIDDIMPSEKTLTNAYEIIEENFNDGLELFKTDNQIIKRAQYLKCISENNTKEQNMKNFEEYKDVFEDDKIFKGHLSTCLIMDYITDQEIIKNRYIKTSIEKDFTIKINTTTLGKIEKLRHIEYDIMPDGERLKNIEELKTMCRLKCAYDENFKYKIFKHVGSSLYYSVENRTRDKNRGKREYKINDEELTKHTNLRQCRTPALAIKEKSNIDYGIGLDCGIDV